MGRHRKASLYGGDGKRFVKGKRRPGFAVRWYEYPAGKRKSCWKTFQKHADAAEWVRRYNARADLHELDRVTAIPLRDAVKEFLSGCAGLRENTTLQYAQSLGMLGGIVGEGMVCDIDGATIDRFVAARAQVSRPATVAKHITAVRRFLRWAVKRGYAEDVATAAATSLPKRKHVRQLRNFPDDELARLIAALDTTDRRLACWIAMTTGLDREVVANLTPGQIDLDGRRIVTVRPKTSTPVAVPIHAKLLPLLAEQMRHKHSSEKLLQGLSRQARHRDWWHVAVKRAGLPEETQFQHLRAVASTRLQRDGGASLTDAQRLLGHASPLTTAAHYSMPNPNTVQALDRLDLPGLSTTSASMEERP